MSRVSWLLLLVLAAPLQALPQQEVEQVLHSLGLQRFFASVGALVERELQQDSAGTEAGAAVIRQHLNGDGLQDALEAILVQHYNAQLYQQAIRVLSRDELQPIIQSCHGQALQDYGPELQAYEQQLQRRPAKPDRAQLAIQLDQAAHSSALASRLHSEIERIIYDASHGAGESDIDWQGVEAERREALQVAVQAWYLYCGRFFPDELLQALVLAHREAAVQQVLEQYQLAVDQVLLQAATAISSQLKPTP